MASPRPDLPEHSYTSETHKGTSGYTYSNPSSPSNLELDYPQKPHLNTQGNEKTKAAAKSKTPRWMAQVKDWLSTAEPSAQAMKEQRQSTFRKHGIALDDPQAAAKLHLSMEKVPRGATTSTSGPTPEEALKQRAATHRTRASLGGRSSRCGSSGSSLGPSTKDHRIAPWEAHE